jgi:P27 family predicted phage terminase small subunit
MPTASELSEEERAVRAQVLATVAPGQVRPADSETLDRFCQQTVLQRQARRGLREWQAHPEKWKPGETALLVFGQRGSLTGHPLLKIINDLEVTIRHLASELGLSPAAREKVSGDETQMALAGGEWDEFEAPTRKGAVQ